MTEKNSGGPIYTIYTDKANKPGGHYSQATVHGGLIYISGQLGFKPGTSEPVVGTIEEQTRHCMMNMQAILTEADSDLTRVLKVTIYISDVAHWPEVNQIYAEYFPDHKPARAIVPCNLLHHGFNVEIEAVAATCD